MCELSAGCDSVGFQQARWCSRLQPGRRGLLRLFCFPHAGATSYVYRPWIAHLPPEVELWGVHPPGRGQRIGEQPFRRAEPLIAELIANLPLDAHQPFAFFGHSLGALVAFEVTRALYRERGISPRHLFVSGHPAPDAPTRHAPLHNSPPEALMRALERYGGVPRDLLDNEELMELLIPAIRADLEVSETYVYHPSDALRCGVTCYGGSQDDEATEEELRRWQHHTTGTFMLQMFEGNHFFPFHSDQYLRLFSAALHSLC